jgi:ribosomal-protein-alanine N-acetyltransferase
MTDPTLRDLVEADLPWMAGVEREIFGRSAWSEPLIREDWRYGHGRYRAVECEGERAGYAVYGFEGDAFHLMNLAILPAFRGRGLAKALMDDFLAEAHRLKAPDAWLEVAVDNEAALALYERYGFTVVRVRRKYYQPEGTDAAVMRLALREYVPATPEE